jgi:BlaI family penicillinase repressor
MEKKELSGLTDLQLQVLDAVWDRGEASVADVHGAMAAGPSLARKTVGTLLVRLEQQGLLAHRQEGREYIYRARVSRDTVRRATVGKVAARLFRGNIPALLAHALSTDQLMPGDVERARQMLDEFDKGKSGKKRR